MSQKTLAIAIANRKGGTGKTTTAVNLAAEWGRSGYKTLLLDLDTQGHAAIGVGCREQRNAEGTVHELLCDSGCELNRVVRKTPVENVWFVPSDTEFVGHELGALRLRDVLSVLISADGFERIVIDTPPTLDSLLINALVAAQGVVVPFVPHHLAEVGVRQLAKLFYQIATQHNPCLKLLGLLPVMYDRHLCLHRRVIEGLGRQFGKKRIMRGIRTNIKLAEAFEAGMPVSLYAKRCAGSMDYQLMADELDSLFRIG